MFGQLLLSFLAYGHLFRIDPDLEREFGGWAVSFGFRGRAMGADVEQYDASVGKVCLSQLFKLFQYSSTHISLTSPPIH